MSDDKIAVKEIFTSIQGEGPYVGYRQLFIRFCNCNLRCGYCDTDYLEANAKVYSAKDLQNIIEKTACHSVSLTGGEPLLHADFLLRFLLGIDKKIYLETNATLSHELSKILNFIDIISADIKLPSATNSEPLWDKHDLFFETARGKELFAKIVFDEKISMDEIVKSVELCRKYSIPIVLQPKMINDKLSVSNIFIENIYDEFFKLYENVRVIPQTHKFLNML